MHDDFRHRLAVAADIPALTALMNRAIAGLLPQFLSPAEVEASFAVMGLDSQLIADGTYFVIEEASAIAGCGGWSRRATLFGGNHTAGRDARLLDPVTEAARVRAMYTDRISCAAAWGGRFSRCAKTRHAPKVSPGPRWARPWPASRSMRLAATAPSKC